MNLVIVDRRAHPSILRDLEEEGFRIIKSLDLTNISSSLSSHPDIQVTRLDQSRIVVEPRTYDYYKGELERYGIQVLRGQTSLGDGYPSYIAYNACLAHGYLLHRLDYTDQEVLAEDLERINLKQGYSKCNLLVTGHGFITSDRGIYKKLPRGKNLLISRGNILLKDYEYGFIGGASGRFGDQIYFMGSLEEHPDFERIRDFLEEEASQLVCLGDIPLTDYGSLIFLQGRKKEERK